MANKLCTRCKKIKKDSKVCFDPYVLDLDGIEVETVLCDDCFSDLVLEI